MIVTVISIIENITSGGERSMAGKKKILFVVEAMGGDVYTYIVNLVKEYDMYIAYDVWRRALDNYRDYFDNRINLLEVKNFSRSINPIKDIKAFFENMIVAKGINPDIVHLHLSKAGALGHISFNDRKTSIFYTTYEYSICLQNHNVGKRMIYIVVDINCSKRNCITISCGEGEHQETLKLNKDATYVKKSSNIRELPKMLGKTESIEVHPFTVFTLGRIYCQKNPMLFSKIAITLLRIKFLWIGDVELRSELTAPNIEFAGWGKREEAIKYSLQRDVFLLTSLWRVLSISLIEFMYMKNPCIVSDVVRNHDVMENGFECSEMKKFVDAIRSIQGDIMSQDVLIGNVFEESEDICYSKIIAAGETDRLIENACKDVMKEYNIKVLADSYTKIYGGTLHKLICVVFDMEVHKKSFYYAVIEKGVA